MGSPSAYSPLPMMEERAALKRAFLEAQGSPADLESTFLAGDCSLRTYDRLRTQRAWFSPSCVLMDAPPPQESLTPFLKVHGLLVEGGLRVPRIYAHDIELGFMLLEDLGDITYNRALRDPALKTTLYRTAVDTLLLLQRLPPREEPAAFGVDVLLKEMNSLFEWGGRRALSEAEKEDAKGLWAEVLRPLASLNVQQPTLVLRDYHVDNLMLLPGTGIQSCGLLDFQDALWGTQAYDLVSLLQDARVDVGEDFEEALKSYFLSQQGPEFAREAFEEGYTLLGLQRATKILGIFLRHARRNQKKALLCHVPRVWRHIQRGLASPLGRPLRPWFQTFFPEGQRHA